MKASHRWIGLWVPVIVNAFMAGGDRALAQITPDATLGAEGSHYSRALKPISCDRSLLLSRPKQVRILCGVGFAHTTQNPYLNPTTFSCSTLTSLLQRWLLDLSNRVALKLF